MSGVENQKKFDPFDWPMPSRGDLMSNRGLDADQDKCHTKTAHMRTKMRQTSANLSSRDIAGCKPRVWAPTEVNKPQFSNQNWDITGACPRQLHIGLNKPEYNLSNCDIIGTKPQQNKFSTKREPSNPLEPIYGLQKVDYIQPVAPRFIRDAMNIDDLPGAKCLIRKNQSERDVFKVGLIEGTAPKKPYLRQTAHDSFSYADVYRNTWATARSLNPLDPVYLHRDAGEGFRAGAGSINQSYGAIKGSKPPGIPIAKDEPGRYLNTQDILGGQAGTKQVGCVKGGYVRQVLRDPNCVTDMDGCQSGTLKRHIQTKRCGNPLVPSYNLPGHSELGINDPFGVQQARACSMSKNNFDAKKAEDKSNASQPQNVKEAVPVQEQGQFKKDMASFYDVNPAATKDVDLEKMPLIDDKAKSTASIPRAKTASSVAGSQRPPRPLGSASQSSKLFQRNADRFYGGEGNPNATQSSQGSMFQKNAAAFCGDTAPATGERPYKIDKSSNRSNASEKKGKSVLYEKKLREDEDAKMRQPGLVTSSQKFYGLSSGNGRIKSAASCSSRRSAAQKLDSFIQ